MLELYLHFMIIEVKRNNMTFSLCINVSIERSGCILYVNLGFRLWNILGTCSFGMLGNYDATSFQQS